MEFWKGIDQSEGKEKMGYITSAYGCSHPCGKKGKGGKNNDEEPNLELDSAVASAEDIIENARKIKYGCSCLCFPRFRGLAVSDGHRGVGLTSVMFWTYFTLIHKLLEGMPVTEGTKISTGRMRKPVLCSVLKDRWNFVPKSSRFEVHMLPSEESGGKGVRVTGQDIGRIRSCFSNNYCKSQDITIVPYDSSQLEGSKIVYVETEYEAEWIPLVKMLKEKFTSFEDTGTWWGGLGEESKLAMEEEKTRRKEEDLPTWQEKQDAAKAVKGAALEAGRPPLQEC